MLKIRLSLGGAKKRPVYKIVVADSRFPRDGRFIEKLGFFNPLMPKEKKERVGLQSERIKYWLSQYLILSGCNPILSFFSFGNSGLKNPNFSINLPSLGNLLSATTILYTGLFFVPPIDNLSFNMFSPFIISIG